MIQRMLSHTLRKAAEKMPIITITGPRQSGKTTLVRTVFPEHRYYNLEYPDTREYAIIDPRGFLNSAPQMIIDEVQNVPNLTSYIQGIVDEEQRSAQFILTGSQNFSLAQSVSQSLAGRSTIFHLLPLSVTELQAAGYPTETYLPWLYRGFYPRLYDQNLTPDEWLPDYIQTYLERDIRQITQVQNLTAFQIFLKLCAGRIGQLLNMASLANEVGVDVKTIKSWVSVLEASYIVFLLRPYYRNYGKRVVKTPKLYFYDTGLACSLLGIKNADQLASHYLKGELFESLIIAELQKHQYHKGWRPTNYFWRDNTGNEVDFLLEDGTTTQVAEIKSGQTIRADFFKGLNFYRKISSPAASYLIYGGTESQNRSEHTVLGWVDATQLLS
ncbi:MAG: ATP-binding protein [Bacteroidota bacterium]